MNLCADAADDLLRRRMARRWRLARYVRIALVVLDDPIFLVDQISLVERRAQGVRYDCLLRTQQVVLAGHCVQGDLVAPDCDQLCRCRAFRRIAIAFALLN